MTDGNRTGDRNSCRYESAFFSMVARGNLGTCQSLCEDLSNIYQRLCQDSFGSPRSKMDVQSPHEVRVLTTYSI
ncbi:hypothetical protein CHS0354_007066 [Potamilus streckersoni]|uniref:Uncharacterized protein n=1 Tax=Potamilus streckersoni TaxID=2493646 RepID=A0AAE0RYT0_9BIVA|nr:hypothetical protein CHS0354_007066 [Potamilus streckersoni]